MATDPPNKGLGVVAVDKEQLEGVHHNSDELDLITRTKVTSTPHSCSQLIVVHK